MDKIKVEKLTPILKKRLCLWDRYKGKKVGGYENFRKYIFNEGVSSYLKTIEDAEIIDKMANFGKPSIERHKYVLKDEKEVKSYICFSVEKKGLKKPRMYINAIASHPLHQGEGYALALLKTILKNPEKYMSVKPAFVYGLVKEDNFSCQALFQKLGKVETVKAEDNHCFNIVKTKFYDEMGRTDE